MRHVRHLPDPGNSGGSLQGLAVSKGPQEFPGIYAHIVILNFNFHLVCDEISVNCSNQFVGHLYITILSNKSFLQMSEIQIFIYLL